MPHRKSASPPHISAGRCVHAVSPVATCKACVEICPEDALILDDEALRIDEQTCTGCGLCQSACVQDAIASDESVAVQADMAWIACSRSQVALQGPTIACVHSQGLEQLTDLHCKGVRKIAIATGDCGRCPNGSEATFAISLARFNTLARSRGLPVLELQAADATAAGAWKHHEPAAEKLNPDRRRFLKLFIPPDEADNGSSETPRRSLAAFQVHGDNDADTEIFAAVPTIDAGLCVGCDACTHVCPESALILVKDGDSAPCYRAFAERCTGCGLCVDVCRVQAVSLNFMCSRAAESVPLFRMVCRICGAFFHIPAEQAVKGDTCPICTQTNHHRNLFQVLE